MSNYTMKTIPKPEEGTRSVLQMEQNSEGPIFKGNANDNYLCGTCKSIICENVSRGQLINLVFVCPNCGSYNEVKGT